MIVADDELHAAYAAFLEAFEQLPPVRLGLAACDVAAKDGPLAVRGDADGGEYRTPAPESRRPCPLGSATPHQADRGDPLAGLPW